MTPMKKSAKKEPAVKSGTPKASAKKRSAKRKVRIRTKHSGRKAINTNAMAFPRESRGPLSGGQSGELQGLSSVEGPDSESVGELIEEGNAFEADVVTGVEDAEDAAEREVHTHEVPEDDVPDEYLDQE